MYILTDLPANMQNKIQITSAGCWGWTGSLNNKGYGQVGYLGRTTSTHRLAYTLLAGPIPAGLHIDHLCRNRACCNPAHLEPVTVRTNTLRGIGFAPSNAAKTHCRHGHAYTSVNTYIDRRGSRSCRTCRTENHRKNRI